MKKNIIKKGLSALMVATLLVSGTHIPAKAETINLSIADVNENQDMFSKTYLYNGEYKTIYVYNDNGTSKMTGDIVFSSGFGKAECRHIDGYIELPIEIKDFEVYSTPTINPFSDLSITYELLFLGTDNKIYSFNISKFNLNT